MLVQRDWDALKLNDVVRFLEDPRIEYGGGGSEPVTLPWEMSAETYLLFARTDLRAGSRRGRVNALGNAKRALHCQVDSILYCAGFWDQAQSRRWDFPTRMDLLRQMEVATPDVLHRINILRNIVEHEYVTPDDPQRLQDFIDVVELFAGATEMLARRRFETSEFTRPYHNKERSIGVELRNGNLVARVYGANPHRRLRARNCAEFKRLQVAAYAANRRIGAFL